MPVGTARELMRAACPTGIFERENMKLLRAIVWGIITFFSPDAGLREIQNENENKLDQGQELQRDQIV